MSLILVSTAHYADFLHSPATREEKYITHTGGIKYV